MSIEPLEPNGTQRRQNVVLDLPAHPCSRDSLISAVLSRRVSLLHKDMTNNHELLVTRLEDILLDAEWFDFGRIDADELAGAATDSHDIVKAGMALPPYELCVFRFRMTSGKDEMETALFVEREKDGGIMISYYRVVGLRADHMILTAGVLIDKGSFRAMKGSSESNSEVCGKLYGGLWIILNCRGVGKTLRELDEKLNKARTRSGKVPLQRVTVIDSAAYMTALKETERVERLSKGSKMPLYSLKPHLRRGHIRRYIADRFADIHIDGVKTFRDASGCACQWIEPMLVNAEGGPPVKRDLYRVKK